MAYRDRIIEIASELETKDSIPTVKAELPLIVEVQTEDYWRGITLPLIEHLRKHLHGLVQFVDRTSIKPVYSVLTDQIGPASEVALKDFSTGINLAQYRPLTLFIRSLVGLDRNAAKEAFGQFLDANRYNSQQIRFVEMIIDRLTQSGVVDPGQLYEPPFTGMHHEGLDGAFQDADADQIVSILRDIRSRAAA